MNQLQDKPSDLVTCKVINKMNESYEVEQFQFYFYNFVVLFEYIQLENYKLQFLSKVFLSVTSSAFRFKKRSLIACIEFI